MRRPPPWAASPAARRPPHCPKPARAKCDSWQNQSTRWPRACAHWKRCAAAHSPISSTSGWPLGAVLAAIEVLRGSAGADPAIREGSPAGVQKELTSLEPLLDDMSQLHAEATGNIRLDRQPVSRLVTRSCPPMARGRPRARTHLGRAEIPPICRKPTSIPRRMSQVIGNLLSNAVKYTESGGIAVYATSTAGEVAILVADTGPGHRRRRLGCGCSTRFSGARRRAGRRKGWAWGWLLLAAWPKPTAAGCLWRAPPAAAAFSPCICRFRACSSQL